MLDFALNNRQAVLVERLHVQLLIELNLSTFLFQFVEFGSVFDQSVYNILQLVISSQMPPRPNLSSTSRALLLVNTIVVLNTSGAKLVQARPDIKRIHIDVSAHRTQQSFFQVFKICGGNNLVLSGIKFEFLEIFSIFQSLHSMVNHFLVDFFLLFLVWEYPWFASHLIHIQDYLLKK